MKATQGGFSELEVLRSLWGMIYGKFPKGVLYMFPTSDDVGEFSKSRFNPLIQANHHTIGRFVKKTDTASLKKIHNAFLFLRGARLSQGIGIGEKESSKLRSISVDRVVFDEVDLMDEQVVAKAKGRMGHSDVKQEIHISNPTLPDFGIDKTFALSDQRYLFRKCDCGHWFSADLEFPGCIKQKDGKGYIGCSKCGKPVGIENIEWVPQKKENSEYMHGYHWSQLSSNLNDPWEILTDFNEPPQGNLGDVLRLRLGLPYVATEDKLNQGDVYECCCNDIPPTSHVGPCAMGVDVGKIKHVVIGVRDGTEHFKIIKTTKVSEWDDIHDLALRYNVKSAVIDARPYEDAARAFQKAEKYKIYLCEYTENSVDGTVYNQDKGIVKANRTEICDHSHRVVKNKNVVIPRKSAEVDDFVNQMCCMAKVLETNKKTGTSIYRYRKIGSYGDHFRHALNYFLLAASGGKVAKVGSSSRQFQKAVMGKSFI
jgi:hypothetical protein